MNNLQRCMIFEGSLVFIFERASFNRCLPFVCSS